MDKQGISSHETRRARTRSLVQLGALISKSGLLETFGVTLGEDLQKSPEQKFSVAALYKGLVELNEMARGEDVNLQIWGLQGLQFLREEKQEYQKNKH